MDMDTRNIANNLEATVKRIVLENRSHRITIAKTEIRLSENRDSLGCDTNYSCTQIILPFSLFIPARSLLYREAAGYAMRIMSRQTFPSHYPYSRL